MPVSNFIWDQLSDSYLMETDGTGAKTAVYTQDSTQFGKLISERRGMANTYYHFDTPGSTRKLTDNSSSVVAEYLYDSWGSELLPVGIPGTNFLWLGQLGYSYDVEYSTYSVRRRNYSASIGRWVSYDPVYFREGVNRFSYAVNRPLQAVDPGGEECSDICGPDIDEWFKRQLEIVKTFAVASGGPIAPSFRTLFRALKVEKSALRHKTRSCPHGKPCVDTITLCGVCIKDYTELGNIAFGYAVTAWKSAYVMFWGGFYAQVTGAKRGFDSVQEVASAMAGMLLAEGKAELCKLLKEPKSYFNAAEIDGLISGVRRQMSCNGQ